METTARLQALSIANILIISAIIITSTAGLITLGRVLAFILILSIVWGYIDSVTARKWGLHIWLNYATLVLNILLLANFFYVFIDNTIFVIYVLALNIVNAFVLTTTGIRIVRRRPTPTRILKKYTPDIKVVAEKVEPQKKVKKKSKYFGKTTGKVYHKTTCRFGKNIKKNQRVYFSGDTQAKNKGYKKCKVCLG